MSCKKKIYTLVKVSPGSTVPPVVESTFEVLPNGTTAVVDPTTLVNCPERDYETNIVCVDTAGDGSTCIEGATQVLAIDYDCVTTVTTVTQISITLPNGTAAPATTVVIPCPEYQLLADFQCEVGGVDVE